MKNDTDLHSLNCNEKNIHGQHTTFPAEETRMNIFRVINQYVQLHWLIDKYFSLYDPPAANLLKYCEILPRVHSSSIFLSSFFIFLYLFYLGLMFF